MPAAFPSIETRLIRFTLDSLALARPFLRTTVRVAGPTFSIGRTSIEIVPDCTPMFPTLLLVGAILSFPATWRWKLAGALLGMVFLWVYNLARIYVLMAVLRYAPTHFDFIHVVLWQTVSMLCVVGCFMLWIRWSERRVTAA